MSTELLDCPFCGGPGDMRNEPSYGSASVSTMWFVRCRHCGAVGPRRSSSDAACDAWTLRKQKPRVPASVE